MRAWLALVRAVLASRRAHRGDWIAGLLGDAVTAAVGLAVVLTITEAVPEIRGFTRAELVVCWGVAEACRSLFWMGFRGLYVANGTYVVGGALDQLLTVPLHPLLQILVRHAHFGGWPGVLWGLAAVLWGTGGLTAAQVGLFVLGVLSGTAVLAGVMTALSSVGFWVLHRGSAVGLAYQVTAFAPYPPSFLPWPVALLVSVVVPFTFAGFAPASWLLGDPPAWTWAAPAVGVGASGLGGVLWHRGLARYGSAGT